jgi:hypothetical protein
VISNVVFLFLKSGATGFAHVSAEPKNIISNNNSGKWMLKFTTGILIIFIELNESLDGEA